MNILQINTVDKGGGAEGSAWNLFKRYEAAGHGSLLAVGQKFSDDPAVLEIPRSAHGAGRPLMALSNVLRKSNRRIRGMYPLTRTLDRLASPIRLRQFLDGYDETVFPGCHQLLSCLPWRPDIIHCHNLHGWYFDLDALADYAKTCPVIVNLRDTWALTGHCAYFLDCMRWKNGCGDCPRLDVYPACRKDRTAENLKRKAEIFRRAKVHLAVPSEWMVRQVAQSALRDLDCKVIPNGIDTAVFCPGDRQMARETLGIPQDAKVVLFAAAARKSAFKDAETLWTAAERLAAVCSDTLFLCVGIAAPTRRFAGNLRCVGFIANQRQMADVYRAADVFWHAAKAEAFGKTVTEAMACGTPVVASAVGGITEQVIDGECGFLAETADDFVRHTLSLLSLEERVATPNFSSSRGRAVQMGEAAAARGGQFSLERQASSFLSWYQELVSTEHFPRP